jgi:FkbM family methyltransferase
MNPGWTFMDWLDPLDPSDFELGHLFGNCKTMAGVADLVRLEFLYKYGGVYVDWDCEPVQPLEPLRKYDFFIGTEDGCVLTNAVMGCTPRHPAIRACIDAVLTEGRTTLDVPPNEATGPWLVSAVLGGRDDVTVLPPEFFYPYPYYQREPRDLDTVVTPFTYVVHHWAHSWRPSLRRNPDQGTTVRTPIASVRGAISHGVHPARVALGRGARHVKRKWDDMQASDAGRIGSFGTYVDSGRVLIRSIDGTPLQAATADLSFTPELVSRGVYDQRFWRFVKRAIRPGDQVVDAGAGIGAAAVPLAQAVGPFGRLHALEPDPRNIQFLRVNLEANRLASRATIVETAACALDGTATLIQDPRFYASPVLIFDGEVLPSTDGQSDQSMDVNCSRLDSLLDPGIPLRLVKISNGGLESDVLQGMQGLIEAGCIELIAVPLDRKSAGENWVRLVEALQRVASSPEVETYEISADGAPVPVSLDHCVAAPWPTAHVLLKMRRRAKL